VLETLRAELGSAAVRAGADTGIRILGRAPAAVVAPADDEQAALALRVCSDRRWSVRAVGAGTRLDAGAAARADVAITTERMDGILEYEPDDLQIAVAAGTTLADLDRAARQHGQFFPVRPPGTGRATAGGAIATGSAGPLRLGHGTPRDHVLGLRLVTGDGRILDLGGRVVKNVAGYDLVRLAVGSRGAIGLITRAHLRLRPLPQRDVTAFFHGADPTRLAGTAMTVAEGWPVAAELLDPASAEKLTGRARWLLAVRWHGNDAFATHITRWLGRLDPRPELAGTERAGPFWSGLARLEADATAEFRLVSLPDRLPVLLGHAGFLAGLRNTWSDNMLDSELGIRWRMSAHARSGILRVWSDQADASHRAVLAVRLNAVRQQLMVSGSVAAPVLPAAVDVGRADAAGPDRAEHTTDADRSDDPARRVLAEIRRAFDPAAILEPVGFGDGSAIA